MNSQQKSEINESVAEKMGYEEYVLDATMGCNGGNFCFCPIEGDIYGEFSVITGMNFIGVRSPGKLVAIVHEEGQAAVEKFCEDFAEELQSAGIF